MMARKNGLDIKFRGTKGLEKLLDAVPQLKRHEVKMLSTQAGAQVILARASSLVPKGTEADRKKRSKKQKAAANWNIRLSSTLAFVTRETRSRAYSVIGPRHPDGNKAYFNSPKTGSRSHVLWGRNKGRTKSAIRNWIVQAFDETRSQQLSAMKAVVKKQIDQMLTRP